MKAKKWIVAIAIVAVVALFIPFVPQTFASGRFGGFQYQRSAIVSPTYYLLWCGAFVNSQVTAQLDSSSGFSGIYQLSKGYTFSCVYNTA